MSVSRDNRHRFSKPIVEQIMLLEGLGIEGDAHSGATTQHRYLVAKDPTRANLCQVHLIGIELYEHLITDGWSILPGQLGENVTTRGIELMTLSTGSILHLGADARVEITGKRSPCRQINGFQPGLMKAVFGADESGVELHGPASWASCSREASCSQATKYGWNCQRAGSARWSRSDHGATSGRSVDGDTEMRGEDRRKQGQLEVVDRHTA